LVQPTRITLVTFDDELIELWLVLEEHPEHRGGYKVVYDESTGGFGLAAPGRTPADVPGYFGEYGDFMEALAAM
jgi:hypothetical protein